MASFKTDHIITDSWYFCDKTVFCAILNRVNNSRVSITMKTRSLATILKFYDDNRARSLFFSVTSLDSNSCISQLRKISRESDRNANLNIDAISGLLASEPLVEESQDFASLTATQKTIEFVRFECGLPCHLDAASASPLVRVYGDMIESDLDHYTNDFNAKSLCPKLYSDMDDDEKMLFKGHVEPIDSGYHHGYLLPPDYEHLGDDNKEKILELASSWLQKQSFSSYLVEVENRIVEKHQLPLGHNARAANHEFIETMDKERDVERDIIFAWNPSAFPKL